jgi:4-amino-4-deoxy-L-arabinose transferase-like glycosyltransferase
MDEQCKRRRGAGLFIPGFMFIGLGVGILFKNAGAGVLLGLGVGFIIWGIFRIIDSKLT